LSLFVMVSMSAFLTLSGLSAATPEGRTLFHDLTLSVGAERIGLVGRNGSGKSTLLCIAAGVQVPSSGSIHRGGTAAMLAQNWRSDQLIGDALGVAEALAIHARIEQGEGTEADFDAVDWMLPAAVDAALADIGLAGVDIERPMGSLSGGERTRIGIARLAIERPDLLLLDEPTNNLDREGRAAIERLVATWPGGVLVASHDRALLERMDRIVELSPIGIRIVGGGWSAFAAARDADQARAQVERDRADAALRATRLAAQAAREAKDRRDRAGRAFAEKGSEPKILLGAKAERAENSGGHARRLAERQVDEAVHASDAARARVEILTPLAIDLPATGIPSQAELLAMEGASVDLGGRRLGPWTMAFTGRSGWPWRVRTEPANRPCCAWRPERSRRPPARSGDDPTGSPCWISMATCWMKGTRSSATCVAGTRCWAKRPSMRPVPVLPSVTARRSGSWAACRAASACAPVWPSPFRGRSRPGC